jgi:hypothetical protein
VQRPAVVSRGQLAIGLACLVTGLLRQHRDERIDRAVVRRDLPQTAVCQRDRGRLASPQGGSGHRNRRGIGLCSDLNVATAGVHAC